MIYPYDPELEALERQLEKAEREARKERIRRRIKELTGIDKYDGLACPHIKSWPYWYVRKI